MVLLVVEKSVVVNNLYKCFDNIEADTEISRPKLFNYDGYLYTFLEHFIVDM